jgi:uncharacterized membrane protein YphA (DoxX/SURF4 family)
VSGLRSRNRAPNEEQRARLAGLRDRLKGAVVACGRGELARDSLPGFDWLYLRDEVLAMPAPPPEPRFTALPFLQASAGPLRPLFRALVPDVDGLRRLTVESAQASLDRRYQQILDHYAHARVPFDAGQRERLARTRDELKTAIVATLREPPLATRIADYQRLRQRARGVGGSAFARERLDADRQKLDAIAAGLLAIVGEPPLELSAQAQAIASLEQLAAGPLPRVPQPADAVDALVRWGLTATGALLLVGLLTRTAALAAALQLAAFYMASPPWPGLPGAGAGGHYLYLDRNLIELVAALVIASSGTGHWLGLDALVSWRRSRRRAAAPDTPPAAGAATP